MVTRATRLLGLVLALGAGEVIFGPAVASAAPIGIVCTNGPNFSLRATTGTIETPDGNSVVMWSYANGLTGGNFQLPGPVLCVNQGDVVQITLKNSLSEPTSLVFPGQEGVTATGGTTGLFANEAAPGDPTGVTYTFTASQPGTYLYESGTDPAKQVEMGLYGAIVVRPKVSDVPGGVAGRSYAYDNASTEYDPSREYLLIFHSIDPDLHHAVATGGTYDFNKFRARYFTVTGRAFPDTIQNNGVTWLPTQPYGSLVRVKPYDPAKNPLPALIRMVNASALNHPFHPHGFHVRVIAQDGRMFLTPGGGDASTEHFGDVLPAGASQDSLFWFKDKDKFCSGSSCTAAGFGANNPLPVSIPSYRNLGFKDNTTWYSGSPYLGAQGVLPTPVVSYNVCGEFYFPWHSHALNEFVNYDEGFGGLATLLRVDPLPGCTAFGSSTKVTVGTLKGGSFSNLSALEAPTPAYYQVGSTATTLRSSMTSLQTSALVSSAAGFPSSGSFFIQVDSELMQVTAGQGTTTWTVARHVLGSVAGSHALGAAVSLVPAVTDWYAGFGGVANNGQTLRVTYQGKNCGVASSTSTCAALASPVPTTLYIWNWRSSSWVQVGATQSIGSTEASFVDVPVPASPAAGKWTDFIGTGASAGQVRVRVLTQRANANAGPGFQSWGNFMKLVYDTP